MEYQDISWRECNIHDNHDESVNLKKDNVKEGADVLSCENGEFEEEEDKDFLFQLFSSPNEQTFDTLKYNIPIPVHTHAVAKAGKSTTEVQNMMIELKGHEEINNSTGLSMWLGSELLSQYILQNPHLIHGKNVLELGSGLGLCGIVSHHVGAKSVLLTDGDINVLSNLRYNAQNNINESFYCNGFDNGSLHGNVDGSDGCASTDAKELAQEKIRVSCPQLIWGNEMDKFKRQFGKSNVILAADCIYMTQSIEPLWKTIDELLEDGDHCRNNDKEINNDEDDESSGSGIVLYTNRSSSSARAPIEMIFDAAARHGFTWTEITLSNETHAIRDDSLISGQVYEFRRSCKSATSSQY